MAHARSASLSAAAVPRRPYPDGWFAVARAADVGGGRPLRVQLAGQDLISYRTRDGDAVTAGAYCPHLGGWCLSLRDSKIGRSGPKLGPS